jgi:uncharacterized protein YraI
MKNILIGSAAAIAIVAASGAAFAQTSATATTDLNVRAGPGPQYEVIGFIGASKQATVEGCLEGSLWCQVSFEGGSGWAYSDYLVADVAGQQIVVTQRPAEVEIPVVEYEATASTTTTTGGGAVAGATTGAIAGALVAGPVGAVVGGVAGAATGGIAEEVLTPDARTYVLENRVDPVYLDGEVVVGAQVPDSVEIREIPDYQYRYVYVNQQPVIVEPETRRIVYVVR